MRKTCTKCKMEKELSEFRVRNALKSGRSSWCKGCYSEHEALTWKRSPDRRSRHRRFAEGRRVRNRDFVMASLSGKVCCDCGESDVVVLQYHHVGEAKKRFNVSDVAQGWSLDVIRDEIAKCIVLCANCHIRRTAKSMNWHRWKTKTDG